MFCVECGAEGEVYDGLCRECFIKRGRFVELPKHVDIMTCAHCGALRIGKRWEQVEDPLERSIGDALNVEKGVDTSWHMDVEEEDERNFKVQVHVDVRSKGLEFEVPLETRVRTKIGSCQDCSRQRGSYYEATVQLRARRREPTEAELDEALLMAEDIVADSGSFITKVAQVKGGLDIFMGRVSDGRALALRLSSKFGARMGETKSQAGRKDGKDIFRSTFLVRFPTFKRGDMVFLDGRVLEIRSFSKSKATLEDIGSGAKTSRTMKEMDDLPVLEREEYLKDAVVVSEQEGELQVMHPESYRTVDVKRPENFEAGTKEIRVVVFDEGLYPYMLRPGK